MNSLRASAFLAIVLVVLNSAAAALDEIHLLGAEGWEDSFITFQIGPINEPEVTIVEKSGARIFILRDWLVKNCSVIHLPRITASGLPRFVVDGKTRELKVWNEMDLSGEVWLLPSSIPEHLFFYVPGEDKTLSKKVVQEFAEKFRNQVKSDYDRRFMLGLFNRGVDYAIAGRSKRLVHELEPHLVDVCKSVFTRLRASGKDPYLALLDPSYLYPEAEVGVQNSARKEMSQSQFSRMMKILVTFIDEENRQ